MAVVRASGERFVHKRIRGGNTACGLSKGVHKMFPASGDVTCPSCHVRPLIDDKPNMALTKAMSLPVLKGERDKARTSILAEAMHKVINA
jgi:hypothetical protein